MARLPVDLVIFDCDGVLVDSEPLSMRVLREVAAEGGVDIDEAACSFWFLGKSIESTRDILASEFSLVLTDEAIASMRDRRFALFRRELVAVPHIEAALDHLRLPCCVASSSQPDRLRLTLSLTGLYARFAPHIFSASEVKEGKPAPDLFLHAAAAMGVAPGRCLVIEDSPAGIQAARRAGMRVFGYLGGAHARGADHRRALLAEGPELLFEDMRDLPSLIGDRSQRPR